MEFLSIVIIRFDIKSELTRRKEKVVKLLKVPTTFVEKITSALRLHKTCDKRVWRVERKKKSHTINKSLESQIFHIAVAGLRKAKDKSP